MKWVYLYIFLQSNLLEVPFYFLFFKKQKSFFQTLSLVTAINSLTHPVVFFVIMNFKLSYFQNILLAESFAIIAETFFFYKVIQIRLPRAFAAATFANLVSWQLAPMLTYILL